MLYNSCGTAYTDNSRFICSSLPLQRQVRKSIDSTQWFPLDVPCTHDDCEIKDPDCRYQCSQTIAPKKPHPATKKPLEQKQHLATKNPIQKEPFQMTKLTGQDQSKLLPVMDPQFNMREICKQCILLEDHLCHDEKRCYDCCVKHFLTIEALAEEAITLDQTSSHSQKLQQLPSRVRDLQSKWHKDPDKNAPLVSQELRKIRKDFQLDAFDVVFYNNNSCKDGVCRINK